MKKFLRRNVMRKSDFNISLGKKYYIKGFSFVWWFVVVLGLALVIATLYLFYVLLWGVMYPNVM